MQREAGIVVVLLVAMAGVAWCIGCAVAAVVEKAGMMLKGAF